MTAFDTYSKKPLQGRVVRRTYTYFGGGMKMLDAKKRGRILVVDDEESIGIGISEILKDEGFETAYVINGKDAVNAVKDKDYNLVFMDIVMPGMNGLEAYREIK